MGTQGYQFIFELAIIIKLPLFLIAFSKLYQVMVYHHVLGATKVARMY